MSLASARVLCLFPKYVPCISEKVEYDLGGSEQQTIRDLDVWITKSYDILWIFGYEVDERLKANSDEVQTRN
jgi:hypothetical protein